MWKEILPSSFSSILNPQFQAIFLASFAVLSLKIVCRYITKLPLLDAERSDKLQRKAAHFECLRTGLDLSFLGIVTFFSVWKLVGKKLAETNDGSARLDELEPTQLILIFVQFGLLLLVLFFTGYFRSPEKAFWRGILVPGLIGWASIYISASVYYFFVSRGF